MSETKYFCGNYPEVGDVVMPSVRYIWGELKQSIVLTVHENIYHDQTMVYINTKPGGFIPYRFVLVSRQT